MVDLLKKGKKSCRDCAYLGYWAMSELIRDKTYESWHCKRGDSPIEETELDTKSCNKFLRKKKGMTLEQQEQNRMVNRLRRNWYYVSALVIGIIGLIIAIWRFLLNN
jgi:hypothetical protein